MRKNKPTLTGTMQKYIKSTDQKENDKHPEVNPESTEMYNFDDRGFKIAIIKKLNEIQENTDRQFSEIRSFFTKEIETIKKMQSEILEMKNAIEERKTNLEALSTRADNMEERISNIEDSNAEMLQMEGKEN